MKLTQHGKRTSAPEVSIISSKGFWLYVNDREYFLSYEAFPWFKEARLNDILDVELIHPSHLYWKKLDVDLELESIENPENYPLIFR